MKKVFYSACLFIGISTLFGLCYYWSFKNALLHYNREAVEQNTQLLQELIQYSNQSEQLLLQLINETSEETVEAAVTQETLQATASYFLETYRLHAQTIEREQLAIPGFMVGIDFKELKAYTEGYMEDMPVNEYLDGLVSFEIVSFGRDEVVLRKTYDEHKVENQFYMCGANGFVVVYYSDLKTVYEYTEIPCEDLPEGIQEALRHGFYIRDAKELYSILEGYTS